MAKRRKPLSLSPEAIEDLSDRMVPMLRQWALKHGLKDSGMLWVTAEFAVDGGGGVYSVVVSANPIAAPLNLSTATA